MGTPLSSQLMAETDARERAETERDALADRLFEMQQRFEAAELDAEKQYGEYLAHIAKVRELLECGSEEDLYEQLRRASLTRVLSEMALRQLARGARLAPLLERIDEHAESLAGLATANAALFRQNLQLQQQLEAGRESHERAMDALAEKAEAEIARLKAGDVLH